ncbi:hypothetical protein [Desulfosarcina sp.]|uniref:hypothetical protein n=1 Tax=Desulfosarcina sp. TaxID=2027861 RepID=UPI003970D15A
MFSGIQEILLIVLIVLGIFLVPRMTKPPPQTKVRLRNPAWKFSRMLRLAIIVSILWPVGCAIYFKPWLHDATTFVTLGIGPVVLGWSLKWVLAGIKNKR